MSTTPHTAFSPGTVLPYADLEPAIWRNGGGMTRQIASGKLGASGEPVATDGEEWDWRLSIADVGTEGDFSAFDGMTRILTVIEGEVLDITIDGAEQQLEKFRPLRFDGGAATSATLPAGPIRDLNLIARTGALAGDVTVVELSGDQPRQLAGGRIGVLLQGTAWLRLANGQESALGLLDSVFGGEVQGPGILGNGLLAVITLGLAGA
jgi:hypothetical protein